MLIETASTTEDPSPEHLGGKGAGVFWMQQNGFNVPMAAIIPTPVCASYKNAPKGTMKAIKKELPAILKQFKEHFGYMPLLSVRSGARVSMPGMMDTILNVGLDSHTKDEWFDRLGVDCTKDCLSRLVEMYGSVVKGIPRSDFEHRSVVDRLELYNEVTGEAFPDASEQLLGSIEAVFNSWNNPRAKTYRKLNNIPEEWGTAVVIQAMVFGNMNDKSATGVLFTRNPDTGDKQVMGEYLVNAQGEDVVAGTHTPMPLTTLKDWDSGVAEQLAAAVHELEYLKGDVQDVEFTVQNGELFILQTRNAKRSAKAAVRLAVDFYDEGRINASAAMDRVSRKQLEQAQAVVLDPAFDTPPLVTGIPACSGVVFGKIVLTAQAAIDCKAPCVLVSKETTPDDIGGMNAAIGIITLQGGATSHAAVVARGMNKPCVVGVGLQYAGNFKDGDTIALDGATGRIWLGEVPVIDGSACPYVAKFKSLMWGLSGCYPMARTLTNKTYTVLRIPELLVLPTTKAVELVAQQLEQARELNITVALLTRATLSKHEDSFFSMFTDSQKDQETLLVQELESKIPVDLQMHLILITDRKTEVFGSYAAASTLEELLMAEGDSVVWTGEPSPAVHKLTSMIKNTGIKVMALGVPTKDGYITEGQLIAGWLK